MYNIIISNKSDTILTSLRLYSTGIVRRHGVYIEKWEGIDTYQIKRMLDDSRYPYLPTWRGYSSNFVQPSSWGNNFGTRIRTYFVPKTNGYHVFYLGKTADIVAQPTSFHPSSLIFLFLFLLVFYLISFTILWTLPATNNEGRLYLSRDEHEEHKSLIASVTGVRFVDPLSYDK